MSFTILLALIALLGAPIQETDSDVAALAASAREFVDSLAEAPPVLPQSYQFGFDSQRRTTVDYLPVLAREDQTGVRLGLLSLPQRRLGHEMLRTVLSPEGYLRVQAIRSLERILEATEVGTGLARDADAYTFQFFGDPLRDEPWAMKFEGHHVSVNATVAHGDLRATPLFLGASPAEVPTGSDAGLRVMAPQQDLARALVVTLTPAQRKIAVEAEFSPGDTIPVGTPVALPSPTGLSAEDMSPLQRQLLVRIIASFADNLSATRAAEALQRVDAHGIDALHFRWRGGVDPGDSFSYWIQGPTVAIQFDMFDDGPGEGANHIHAMWRDPTRDFGQDLLKEHYERSHPGFEE